MRLKGIKMISLSVLLIFLMSHVAFALPSGMPFKDVGNHWGLKYIHKMKLKNIVSGVTTDTFAPNSNVTKLQSIIMIVRLMGLSQEADAIKTLPANFTYGSLVKYGHGYITTAYNHGILKSSDLATFNPNSSATRSEVAVYIGRALDIDITISERPDFNDAASIPYSAWGYVNVLSEKGVITGDAKGNFRPDASITRAEMAAILSRVDWNLQNAIDGNSICGEIVGVQGIGEKSVTIYNGSQNITLPLDSTVAIYGKSGAISINSISVGNYAEVIRDGSGKVIYMEIGDKPQYFTSGVEADTEVTGFIDAVLVSTKMIQVEDAEGEKHIFRVSDNAVITLNNSTAVLSSLSSGLSVKVSAKDDLALKIEAATPVTKAEGVIKEIKFNNNTWNITIINVDEQEETYPIDEDVDVERNGHSANLSDLIVGDEVTLRLSKGKVTDIDADAVEGEAAGTIQRISIGAESFITIKDKDGKELSYTVLNTARIRKDGKTITIGELKYGDYVELEIESGRAVEIDVESRQVIDYVRGEVINVNQSIGIIIIRDDITNTQRNVALDDDGIIRKSGRIREDIKYIEEGDYIFGFGTEVNGVFEADTIVVTETSE